MPLSPLAQPNPTTTFINPHSVYGSPNQASRAQQSRHQLAASSHSASSTPRSVSAAPSPSALEHSDPLSNPLLAGGSQDTKVDPATLTALQDADASYEDASLSGYPSIRDIQAQAQRHQQYYYPADYPSPADHHPSTTEHNSRWTPKPFRKPPLQRNYDSYRSIAHPFESFSDSDHSHPNHRRRPNSTLFGRLASRASEFGRNMYAQNQNGNDGTADQHQHQHVHVGPAAGVNGGQHIPSASKLPGGDLYRTLRWSRQRPPMTRERKLLLLRSYLPDWIITIVLAGLLALINNVHGFRREFSLTDTSIQHTFATSERVPMWLLGVSAVIVPALIIAGVALGVSRSVWDLHNGLLGFVLAHCLNVTATTIIKVCVGRPRPDLIDRCQPRPGSANAQPYGLATDAICSVGVDNSELRDGFRSFPSGHASSAFAGLTFLSLYLAAKMHLFDRRGHAISAWLTLTPMLGAVLIAVSRTMDYRHHATDVIAGGILGFVMAFSVYRLYFPPLSHPLCHKPYSPRIPREGMFSTGAGYDEGDVEENASELDDSPRHQHRHHHHHHHHRHHGADTAAAVGGDGAGGATTTTTYGGAPGAGTHSRQGSDARMLDATKGVVQAYERDPSPVHGAKASLEDDYVPETVNRV